MNLANNLSLFRILLVPLFVMSLLYYSPTAAFWQKIAVAAFLLACITDAVDGYIARKLNQKTVLGSFIDPIADKLLLIAGFLSLSMMTHLPDSMRIPAWVTITVITRDLVILIGSSIIFITTQSLKAEPLIIGKITTFFQMLTLACSLLNVLPSLLLLILFILTVALTLASGVLYVRMGSLLLQSSQEQL